MSETVKGSTTGSVTPLFRIKQTETDLQVHIRTPHSREREMEVFVEEQQFYFETYPYYLHLQFPQPVFIPDEETQTLAREIPVRYDVETGIAVVSMKKRNRGQNISSVDVIPPIDIPTNSLSSDYQSFLDNTVEPNSICHTLDSLEQEFENDVVNIDGITTSLNEVSLTQPKYGFAARYTAVFHARAEDSSQIVQLPSPDSTPVWRRPSLRKAAEDEKFDADHYIADFLLEHEFQNVLDYCPRVETLTTDRSGLERPCLPSRQFSSDVNSFAAADLAGIVFAAAYDSRSTCGERNVESAWTISCLSPTLSWLENMKCPRDSVLAAYRRSLAYPLYRSCKIADLVLKDIQLFFKGDVQVVKERLTALLWELYDIFEKDSVHRLLCDIFFVDYCIWIDTVPTSVIEQLQQQVSNISIEKHELEWNLESLEQKARRLANGEEIDDDDMEHTNENDGEHYGQTNNPLNEIRYPTESNNVNAERSSPDDIIVTSNKTSTGVGFECKPLQNLRNEDEKRYGPPSDGSISTTSSKTETDSSSQTSNPPLS